METQQTPGTSGNGAAPATGGAATGEKQEHDSVMLFLAYFGIFALIPYLTVKDDDYVRWHAKQGLTFAVTWFVAWIVITFIPLVNLLLMPILGLAGLILWIMALIKAFGGERWKIPVVGSLAEKW